jgi:hypothetical protein
MEIFYETFLDLLNAMFPSGVLTTELASLNELLAYMITITVLYVFLLRPFLKLLKVVK